MSWKPLIHIISPDADERGTLRAQLLGADYNVLVAHDPGEAIDKLKEGTPHLIVIDQEQADADSADFAALVHHLEGASPLPYLLLMDNNSAGTVPLSLREGLDDTLMRPVNTLELLARVRSLLRNRQLLGQIRIQEMFLRQKKLEPYVPEILQPTVLLVEDEAAQLQKIGDLISKIPCMVIKAQSSSEALQHIKDDPPQLVIIDFLFPDQDGLELCRYLKRLADTRTIPLLMLTSMPELDNRIVGMDAGPDDYLVKPVNPVEVITRVRRLLARQAGHMRLSGNMQILNNIGLTDQETGIPGDEFFRFSYPELIRWSQRAQLPFTIVRMRLATKENFYRLATTVHSTLRNFDMIFVTGEADLSLILPETQSDQAQIALSRILSRAEVNGVPPWEVRSAMVSVGEEGWDSGEIRKKLKIGKMEDGTMADFDADGDNRILVVGDKSGVNLVQLLKEEGFSNAEAFVFEGDKLPDILNANAVIIQGDLDKIPDLAHQLLPALPDPSTPIIVQYSERSEDSDLTALPESADYIPPGASNDYLIHRLRRSLDMVQAQSDAKEVESFILRLIRLMEEGDSDVLGHSQQVAIWAVRLGGRMGLSPEEIEALKWGGLLHDIGKLFLPGKILSKSRMLTAEEFAITKSHPRLGFDLCNGIGILEPALPIIKYHHERMDGKGYPEGLRGDKIPLLARIIAVPDVFDTLIRRRPYRPAFPVEEASKIVMSEAEKGMWDINIAKQFLEMIQRK